MKEKLIRENYQKAVDGKFSKIILIIVMPNGKREIIINDDVIDKLDYINCSYDTDLKLKTNKKIHIENYILVKNC